MGFDNECILNIQSLAGEYFCPVCRLLVYPHEALQSQCTHLYCKPCLTYVVSTTRACPYDGYLVTEADSKPLVESNKTLAETIGKIAVHCLYHRSGCTWQGPLSDCVTHCSGCAFGNSPVLCNRCGIQLVHRQVQEHAQTCPGMQPQAQQVEGSQGTTSSVIPAVAADQTHSASVSGMAKSQAQPSQSVAVTAPVTAPGQDPHQQANASSQGSAVVQAAMPTPEQWYQQQQQYQQYYQQYPGYDPYQQQYQQYYPYQQQTGVQYQQPQVSQALPLHVASQQQPQAYMQPQSQPQPQPQVPVHPHSQPQAQPQPQPQPQHLAPPQPLPQPQQLTQSHGQSQSHMHIQAPAVGQSQNQGQVNPQQQLFLSTTPLSQIQPQSHPPAHGQAQPQPQSYPQVQPNSQQLVPMHQYQQPHSQALQQPSHPQFHQQHHHVSQPPPLSQAAAQHHSQLPNQQNNQSSSVTPNALPQTQNPPAYAAAGYNSYPQPQHHQQIQLGVSQNAVPSHPQGGAHPQSQQPVQMHVQLPQPPPMRPPQPPAMYQNQQSILPSPGQVHNVSAAQTLHAPSQAQQPGGPGQSVNQRPAMQLVQQPASQQVVHHHQHFGQQGQFTQHQLPMTSQLRPQGPPNLLTQHNHGYAHLQQNINLPHGMQHNQFQNPEGRPVAPSHGAQSIVGSQVRPIQPGANQPTKKLGNAFGNNIQVHLSDGFGEHKLEKDVKRTTNQLDVSTNVGADAGETEKSEANLMVSDDKSRFINGDKSIQADASTENTPQFSSMDSNLHVGDDDKSITKQMEVKVEAAESTLDGSINHKLGDVKVQDQKDRNTEPKKMDEFGIKNQGTQGKIPASQDTELSEEQSKRMQNDSSRILHPSSGAYDGSQAVTTTSLILGSPESTKPKLLHQHGSQDKNLSQTGGTHSAGGDGYKGSTPVSQVLATASGGAQPSHPVSAADHTRYQKPPTNVAAAPLSQALPPGPIHHAQVPNNPAMQFRPRAPGLVTHPGQSLNPSEQFLLGGIPESGSASSFGRGPSYYGPQQPLEHLSIAPQGGNFRLKLPGAFDTRGLPHASEGQISVQRPIHPMEAEVFPNQRPRPDLHLPGSMEYRPPHLSGTLPNMLTLNGGPVPDSSKPGLRDERFKLVPDEQLNPFPLDAIRRPISQMESEHVLRQFPRPSHLDSDHAQGTGSYSLRPSDKAVRGQNYDSSLSIDGAASRFMPPRHMGGSLHLTDAAERPIGFYEDSIGQSDRGRGSSNFIGLSNYGRNFVDGFAPRSPLHEYRGRGFGGHPGFPGADEIDGQDFPRHLGDPLSFHESRFPIFRSHLQRAEFEGPGNFRMGEHVRSGDLIEQDRHFGPRSLPGHLRLGELTGFGSHPGHSRIGDLSVLGNFEPFGGGHRSNHPRLGEPGFRSSFSRQGLPDDSRFYAGDMDSFDFSRKRKAATMGWCRICKVDCETVEGLELHSQTREHQKMAMDIVQSIKQNAKKQKVTPIDHSSLEDASKLKNTGLESRGKKH